MSSWTRGAIVFVAVAALALTIAVGAVFAFDGEGHHSRNGHHDMTGYGHHMGMMGGQNGMSIDAMTAMMRGVLDEDSLNQMLALMQQHIAGCQTGDCPVDGMHEAMHSLMGAGDMPGHMQGHHP